MKTILNITRTQVPALTLAVTLLLAHPQPSQAQQQPKPWDLNDVSILYPLPSNLQDNELIRTDLKTRHGELLPKNYASQLPPLTTMHDPETLWNNLRVVGIRIDPCFTGTSLHSFQRGCRGQIRLIWQPFHPTSPQADGSKLIAIDAAIHSFYELTPQQFQELKTHLMTLKSRSGGGNSRLPLGVHPILARQGLQGSFALGLRQLLAHYAGEKRLSQITFMQLTARGNRWDFGGATIENGVMRPITIPRIQKTRQIFVNPNVPPLEFKNSQPFPTPVGADTFNFLLKDSAQITASDAEAVRQSVQAIHRIENPRIHSVNTMDCVSCHLTQPARFWAIRKFPEMKLHENPFRFHADYDLRNLSPLQRMTNIARAFGYFGRKPAISQRTIHESAVVADQLNQSR